MDGLVARGIEAEESVLAMADARAFERERRWTRRLAVGGGWFMAGVMGVVAVASLGVVMHRPVPQDRFCVSLIRDNGIYEPPMLREDLPESRREVLFRHTVIQYVLARENHTWESVKKNYRAASAMSDPEERDRYQAVMRDEHNPDNPAVKYGKGAGAPTVDVKAVRVIPDKDTPNAVEAQFIVEISQGEHSTKLIRKTARMSWVEAPSKIPIEIQQMYDPAAIAFVHYTSTEDPA